MSVTIPDTVTLIGDNAFWGCKSLMTIVIPKSVTEISDSAFDGCDSLVIYCTKNSKAHIFAYYAGIPFILLDSSSDFRYVVYKKQVILLAYTGKAATVNIPSKIGKYSVTTIAENAFYGNRWVRQITVPSTVKEIGSGAFMCCTSLTDVNLPAGLTSLGAMSFALCPRIARITLPGGIAALNGSTFIGCASLSTVALPGSLKKIEAYDFAGCPSLKELIVPQSVSAINPAAFSGTDVTLVVLQGSFAETYAKAQGIAYRVLRNVKITVVAKDGSVTGAGQYIEGKTVTLAAKARKGYEFLYWVADGKQIKGATYTFIASQDQSIEAVFDWAGKTVVKLDKTSSKLKPGETCTLTPSILPRKRANQKLTWKSSNAAIAQVKDGVVTAVKNGTVTITATATDGSKSSAKCTITVRTQVDSIGVTGNQTLSSKQTTTLRAVIAPATASDKGVNWKSSNSKVATVSSSGKVTAQKVSIATTVTITAVAKDGTGISGSIVISVLPPVQKVLIAPAGKQSIDLAVSNLLKLGATASPADARQAVQWTTSDKRVATVDSNGLVKALKPGTVTITASATDGSGKKAACTVKIVRSPAK